MVKNLGVRGFVLLFVVGLCSSAVAEKAIPKPKLKPALLQDAIVQPYFPPEEVGGKWPKTIVDVERRECAHRLKGLQLTYEPMAPFGQLNGCGAAAAVKVSMVAGVSIVPAAEMTCDLAEAVHGWVTSSLLPNAKAQLKKRVIKINNASAYVCRRRNNATTGKLSEHAKANALDISTLGFDDGSSVNIKGDWSGLKQFFRVSTQGNFLRAIRRDACIRFTTVLGPGSDPYHGDHFHIDVARRKNGYRICS
jgi:hypothetical protein